MNFEQFETEDYPRRSCNFKITDSENVVRSMSQNPRFRGPSDKQHAKRALALLKSALQHFYDIH